MISFIFHNVSLPLYFRLISPLTIGDASVMCCSLVWIQVVVDLFQSSVRIPSPRYLLHVLHVHICYD